MGTTLIRISRDRATQLAMLAKSRDVYVTHLIDDLVEGAIEAGELPDVTPGVHIAVDGDRVHFQIGDAAVKLSASEARGLGNTLWFPRESRMIVTREGDVIAAGPANGRSSYVDILDRAGGKVKRTFTSSVAAGLRRQIDAVCDAIEKPKH